MRTRASPCLRRRWWSPYGLAALACACGVWAGRAEAATSCGPAGAAEIERCVAGLAPDTLRHIYEPQQASNWCWAASVSMLLRRYGVSVPQERVVRAHLGRVDNVQVGADGMQALLSRQWEDGAGRQARTSATNLPPWHRGLGLAAPEVLADLAQDRPLMIGVQHHAMLLVQVVFERRTDGEALTPAGVRILRATVLDPDSGAWLRSLRASERQPEYIARVQVVAAPGPQLAALAETAAR